MSEPAIIGPGELGVTPSVDGLSSQHGRVMWMGVPYFPAASSSLTCAACCLAPSTSCGCSAGETVPSRLAENRQHHSGRALGERPEFPIWTQPSRKVQHGNHIKKECQPETSSSVTADHRHSTQHGHSTVPVTTNQHETSSSVTADSDAIQHCGNRGGGSERGKEGDIIVPTQ